MKIWSTISPAESQHGLNEASDLISPDTSQHGCNPASDPKLNQHLYNQEIFQLFKNEFGEGQAVEIGAV